MTASLTSTSHSHTHPPSRGLPGPAQWTTGSAILQNMTPAPSAASCRHIRGLHHCCHKMQLSPNTAIARLPMPAWLIAPCWARLVHAVRIITDIHHTEAHQPPDKTMPPPAVDALTRCQTPAAHTLARPLPPRPPLQLLSRCLHTAKSSDESHQNHSIISTGKLPSFGAGYGGLPGIPIALWSTRVRTHTNVKARILLLALASGSEPYKGSTAVAGWCVLHVVAAAARCLHLLTT